jgi:hypothetical protein
MNTLSPEQAVRKQRAQEQASDYIITPHWTDRDAFTVIGRRGQAYDVTPEGCSCPDAQKRGTRCKHFWLVRAHVASLIQKAASKPEPIPCGGCGRDLQETGVGGADAALGGPVCPDCSPAAQEQRQYDEWLKREQVRRQMEQDFPNF